MTCIVINGVAVKIQQPAASWSMMVACTAGWLWPLYRHDDCNVADWQPQPVPDGYPDWEFSGAGRLCRIPVRPPAIQLALARHGCDKFLRRWDPGCAWGIDTRIPGASRRIEPHARPVRGWCVCCWID